VEPLVVESVAIDVRVQNVVSVVVVVVLLLFPFALVSSDFSVLLNDIQKSDLHVIVHFERFLLIFLEYFPLPFNIRIQVQNQMFNIAFLGRVLDTREGFVDLHFSDSQQISIELPQLWFLFLLLANLLNNLKCASPESIISLSLVRLKFLGNNFVEI